MAKFDFLPLVNCEQGLPRHDARFRHANLLAGLDENGVPPPRLPWQGPIPDEDADALGTLAP